MIACAPSCSCSLHPWRCTLARYALRMSSGAKQAWWVCARSRCLPVGVFAHLLYACMPPVPQEYIFNFKYGEDGSVAMEVKADTKGGKGSASAVRPVLMQQATPTHPQCPAQSTGTSACPKQTRAHLCACFEWSARGATLQPRACHEAPLMPWRDGAIIEWP